MPIELIGMIGVTAGRRGRRRRPRDRRRDRRRLGARLLAQAHETRRLRPACWWATPPPPPTASLSPATPPRTPSAWAISSRTGPASWRPPWPRARRPRWTSSPGGRVSLHIITGGSDADQARDGDWLDHDTRYRRTDEYLGLLRRTWTEERPFDFEGEFYRGHQGLLGDQARPAAAYPALLRRRSRGRARHRRQALRRLHALGRAAGRHPPARRRGAHGERAASGASRASASRCGPSSRPPRTPPGTRRAASSPPCRPSRATAPALPEAVGAQRLVEFARQGELHDKRLWTPIAAAVGGAGNTTALVGTPGAGGRVPPRLLRPRRAPPSSSAASIRSTTRMEYGRELIPLVRAGVARRDRDRAAV